jgi:isopropylmalate/homocitrate/citramalate synthase
VSDKVNAHEKFGIRREIVNGVAQRGGKPIVRIFGQFMCSEKDDEAIERFRADKQKEDTADRFQDAIHALYENADREKAMHLLSGHCAGHLHRTT